MSDDSAAGADSGNDDRFDVSRRKLLETGLVVTTAGALAGCGGGGTGGAPETDTSTTEQDDGTTGGGPQPSDKVVKLKLMGLSRENGPETFAALQQVTKQWKELGIDLELEAQSWNEWIATNYGDPRNYKVSYLAWGGDAQRIDPLRYLGLYYSKIGGYNSTRYNNPEYDEAFETLQTSYDRNERQQAAYKCQEILCDDAVTPIMYYPIMKGGVNTEKFGNWKSSVGNIPYRNVWTLTSLEPKTNDTTVLQPIVNPPNVLNPMAMDGNVDNIYHRMVYDRLVRLDPDDGSPRGSSAKNWEFVDDTTVDVTLKEGLTFTDGKPVRPEDVKFTWDYFVEQGHPYFSFYFNSYDSSEVTDDRTIRFNLSKPDAGLVSYGFYLMPILPQHVWEGVVEEEGIDHPRNWSDPDFTASGPFKAVEVNLPDRMILEVNEDYHMDFNGIEQFILKQFGGNEQALVELQKGNAAFINGILTSQLKRIRENQDGNWDHVEPFSQKMINWANIQFHMEREPSNDVALRRACAHALNQQVIVDIAFDGIGAIPGESSNVVAPHNEFWHNPDVKTYEGGVEAGRQVLEDAGYGWNDQGQLVYPEDMLPIEPPGPN